MKGDKVVFHNVGNYPLTLEIKTAGRRFTVEGKVRGKAGWMVATELTRGGKPTGRRIEARVDALVGVEIEQGG